MGRRAIPIKYIKKKERRRTTFSKRLYGLLKKTYELSVLSGSEISIDFTDIRSQLSHSVVFDQNSNSDALNSVINSLKYRKSRNPHKKPAKSDKHSEVKITEHQIISKESLLPHVPSSSSSSSQDMTFNMPNIQEELTNCNLLVSNSDFNGVMSDKTNSNIILATICMKRFL